MANKKLHEELPREQAGSQTGDRYEYQYSLAAVESFQLLESDTQLCVYCEWHDDFVVEHSSPSLDVYCFSQVKTRTLSAGPWKINQLFGVPRANADPLDETSPFFRMLQNAQKFGATVRSFTFLTNAGIESKLEKLLSAIHSCATVSILPKDEKKEFDRIWNKYSTPAAPMDENDFFILLKKLFISPESGQLGDHINSLRSQIVEKIEKFCEIDLRGKESLRIAENLLAVVRSKSGTTIKKLPIAPADLKTKKGISFEDVFRCLPISESGFAELQKAGSGEKKKHLLEVSRLERLCETNGIPKKFIPNICALKVCWDVWYLTRRGDFPPQDLATLRAACLATITKNDLSFEQLDKEAAAIESQFNPKLTQNIQLTKELVMGYFFSLAAELGLATK